MLLPPGRLHYLTFDISWWKRHTNNTAALIRHFIKPVIETVEVREKVEE